MTQSDGWCPNGSQSISPQPIACPVTIDLMAAAGFAAIFPNGIFAEVADLISGLELGTIESAALCQMPPADPGPFPIWAIMSGIPGGLPPIAAWIALSIERFWWFQCCTCKPPPTPPGVKIADWSFVNWVGGNLMVQPYNPAYGYGSIIYIKGNVTNVEAAGTGYWQALAGHYTPTVAHTCPNGTAFSNQIQQCAWGPGSAAYAPHSHGNYGQDVTSVDMYTTISSQDCIGIAVGKQGTTAAHISGHIELWQQITDPLTYPPDVYPPALQPVAPGGGSSGGPHYGPPAGGTAYCNFAPISANNIQRIITPQSRVANGGVHHVSGSAAVLVESGAVGFTVALTHYPPAYSHDAGDPPQVYNLGWVATSYDGAEGNVAPQPIKLGIYTFWALKPIDHYVIVNLYPQVEADIQFWGTGTPT